MIRFVRELHLERIINILLIIQCIGIVWMTFLYARGDMFPASVLLFINGGVFIWKYGNVSYAFETILSRLFLIFVLVEALAFGNYLFDDSKNTRFLGGLFYNTSLFEFFCYSLVWYLNYLFFYIYTKKSDSVILLKIFVILYFVAGILNNYRAHMTFHVQNGDLSQINYFYYALIPLPLLFYFVNNKLKYIFLVFALLCVIYGYKRSGIFACGLIFIVNFFIDSSKSIKSFLLNCFLTLIIIFVSSYYVGNNKAIERTQTRLERLDSDGGSGRTKNIENIIERVKTAPTVNQIFGYGFMGHVAKYHKMVDVEVFAILYYYGIVGWLVYIVIHIWLIRKICYLYRIRDVIGSNVLSSYSTCYSILIFYSIAAEPFSYLFFFCLIFVYLGFIEAYLNEHYNIV